MVLLLLCAAIAGLPAQETNKRPEMGYKQDSRFTRATVLHEQGSFSFAALTEDGKTLVFFHFASAPDKWSMKWDVETGVQSGAWHLTPISRDESTTGRSVWYDLSPTGKYIWRWLGSDPKAPEARRGHEDLSLVNVETGAIGTSWRYQGTVEQTAPSGEFKEMVLRRGIGLIMDGKLHPNKPPFQFNSWRGAEYAHSPDYRYFGGRDGARNVPAVLDLNKKKFVVTPAVAREEGEGLFVFSASSSHVAVSVGLGSVEIFKLSDGKSIARLDGPRGIVSGIRLSRDVKRAAILYMADTSSRTLVFWDVENRKQLQSYDFVRTNDAPILLGSEDGHRMALVRRLEAEIFDGTTGARLRVIPTALPDERWASADGRWLAGKVSKTELAVWDLEKRAALGIVDMGHEIASVQFSPQGERLFSAPQSGSIVVLDVGAWKVLTTVPKQDGERLLGSAPGGDEVFVGGRRGVSRIRVADGTAVWSGRGDGPRADVSADGGTVAVSGGVGTVVLDGATGETIATLKEAGYQPALSRDGARVALISIQGEESLVYDRGGKFLTKFKGRIRELGQECRWSADGKKILAPYFVFDFEKGALEEPARFYKGQGISYETHLVGDWFVAQGQKVRVFSRRTAK